MMKNKFLYQLNSLRMAKPGLSEVEGGGTCPPLFSRYKNFLGAFGLLLFLLIPSVSFAVSNEAKVKIGIFNKNPSVKVVFQEGGQLIGEKGRKIKTLRPNEKFEWSLQENSSSKSRRQPRKKGADFIGKEISFQPKSGNVFLNGKGYRGLLVLKFAKDGVQVINIVGLEDYLRGVVGSEISSRSSSETLMAQAVIARTYAYFNRGKHGKEGFDLCNNTHCQTFGAMKAERPTVDKAVRDTRGIIMIYKGQPISTLYHATCGGMTSDNDQVWGGAPAEYLRRVKCSFCIHGQNFRWTKRISMVSLKAKLKSEKIELKELTKINIFAPAPMDRVSKVEFVTGKGTFSVKGTTFRRLFDLPSTTFVKKNFPTSSSTSVLSPKNQTLPAAPISDFQPQMLVIQYLKGVRRVLKPREGWFVISESNIQPLVFESTPSVLTYSPRTNTPSMAFRGHTPPRGDKPALVLDASNSQKVSLKGGSDKNIDLTLWGRGYGHQVGLCQSGAMELGRKGWSYRQILPFYYSNVALRRLY